MIPTPSPRQLAWHALELYGFLHFTVNTFTGLEWGYGDESPDIFAPSDFSAEHIAATAKDGGLKGLILTAKHHDGFCLWPSAYTQHSVKNSAWMQGRGDVVRALSDACARAGLKFGVYLSPWDRNHRDYAAPAYLEYYRAQLRELMTQYGPLFEVWFDGANGGDGYYGGAREMRKIDAARYYDWEATWSIVREHQPDACIFSDTGPDIRWVGNEHGIAGDPCWSTISTAGMAPGLANPALLNAGMRDGDRWLPAECDVSLRPGWFYHAEEDGAVKTPEALLDLYFASVGRGASLLLNLPPDRRGRIHERDAEALRGFRALLDTTFAVDLARQATTASADDPTGAARVNDGDASTYWHPQSAQPALELAFAAPVRFSILSLREYLPLGQRIGAFALDAWQQGGWIEVARAEAVGNRRLLRLPETITDRVRLRVLDAAAAPAIREIALF